MAAGFQSWAQDGSAAAQIDDAYQNLHLRRRSAASTNYNVFVITGGTVSGVLLNIGSFVGRPYVAISSASYAAVMQTYQNGDGTWSSLVYVQGAIGTAFTWYAFDSLAAADMSDGYGLMVYRADGAPLFNSLKGALRVSSTMAMDGPAGSSWTGPSGRAFAVAMSPGCRVQSITGSSWIIFAAGVRVNGTLVEWSWFQYGSNTGSSVATENYPAYGVVCDVTNF